MRSSWSTRPGRNRTSRRRTSPGRRCWTSWSSSSRAPSFCCAPIGSDSVHRSLPATSAYVAAKAAQRALATSWARELGPYGITVNVAAPGWIPTERHADVPETELARYLAATPVGRLGIPQDVAAAVAYLASAEASFVNGATIIINGGHTIP